MDRGNAFIQHKKELQEQKKLRQQKQDRFFETSSDRNEKWSDLAQEKIKTEKLNRKKDLCQSKSVVMMKIRGKWPMGAQILDIDLNKFIMMVLKIDTEEHKLYTDLLQIESSLNMNISWDILKLLVKAMIDTANTDP